MTHDQHTQPIDFQDASQSLGGRIRIARLAKGLTKKALAAQLSIKKSTVTAWEDGTVEPRANHLQKLSGLLGVSLLWLMSGEDNGSHNVEDSLNQISGNIYALDEIRELKELLATALKSVEKLETAAQ